jgi:hypothetical protein
VDPGFPGFPGIGCAKSAENFGVCGAQVSTARFPPGKLLSDEQHAAVLRKSISERHYIRMATIPPSTYAKRIESDLSLRPGQLALTRRPIILLIPGNSCVAHPRGSVVATDTI